jgi:hypothetical protein
MHQLLKDSRTHVNALLSNFECSHGDVDTHIFWL